MLHLEEYPLLHFGPLLHLGAVITFEASMLGPKCNNRFITFRTNSLLHLGPNFVTFRTFITFTTQSVLHLGPLLHLGPFITFEASTSLLNASIGYLKICKF